jgi:16S rRNA (adenine1518-N6/adenine1519-N6)-dimethyltransferase
MQKLKPLKRFGQNYLLDQNILNKIVREIDPKPEDQIVEIGPGQGALTAKLFEKVTSLTAVEIDKRVADDLSEKFPGLGLIVDDFLNLNLSQLVGLNRDKRLRIVGNIPYNLTSSILFQLIKYNDTVQDSVLMVQHEVAKRMSSSKGTKDYGILSVILKYFAEVKYCFKVSPNVFYPKPKVDSAVIHIQFKGLKISDKEKQSFINIVKASFGNRRKTLKNSLSNSIFKELNFADSGIDLSLRAEQLDLDDFLRLAEFAREYKNNLA